MARKNTLRVCKLPSTVTKIYEIGLNVGEKNLHHMYVSATRIEVDLETLKIYEGDELTGEFHDWIYYCIATADEV